MSADNGIYILVTMDQFKDEYPDWVDMFDKPIKAYRVAYAFGIDDLNYIEKNQLYMVGKFLHDVWGRSRVFYEEGEAMKEALEIQGDKDWTEYGICTINCQQYSFN